MYYEIIPNKFAPKRSDKTSSMNVNSHSICYGKCNFNCAFCDFKKRPITAYRTYDNDSFEKVIIELLKKGNNFKFTGGEPTLNPKLEQHLEIVKKNNGYIYLDSNGSNPEILEKLIKKDLIDVLGISLKGINQAESMKISNIKKQELVWDNVFRTLEIASQYSDRMRTIVTLVFTKENRKGRLEKFSKLINKYSNVYMKINNLQRDDHPEELNMHSADVELLYNEIKEFANKHPEWKEKIIYVSGADGVYNYNRIVFF